MNCGSTFVVATPQSTAATRLFCFPHAGGGPVVFFEWSQRLGREIECVGIQYPGRGQRLREEPLTTVCAIVDEISHGLAQFFDKPFAFYGHSFGGIVAFELARQLRRKGMPEPDHLFVGAARAPHLKGPHPPIHMLPEEEFVANVQSRYGGIPAEIYRDPEVLKMFMPAMRADFTAYETYEFQVEDPLKVPITAFAGEEDRAVKPACLSEWAFHTVGAFDMKVLPGGHFFPTKSATDLIQALQRQIAPRPNEQRSMFVG